MAKYSEHLQKFLKSEFYAKYKDTYFADAILKKVFEEKKNLHRLYGLKEYSQVYSQNLKVLDDLKNMFLAESDIEDKEFIWKLIYVCYLDPDAYEVREIGGVKCTVDGLISIRRMFKKYGFTDEMLSEYEVYRKVPIIFFPSEKNGINMSRASIFGDRIDYTLYDLKRYYEEGVESTRLKAAYKLPYTKKWLDAIGSFEKLVERYGIKGIFVDEKLNVYDLEAGDDSIITGYLDSYSWYWSENYYSNLKRKIEKFLSKIGR